MAKDGGPFWRPWHAASRQSILYDTYYIWYLYILYLYILYIYATRVYTSCFALRTELSAFRRPHATYFWVAGSPLREQPQQAGSALEPRSGILQDAKGSQQVASHSHGFDTQLQLKLFSIIFFIFCTTFFFVSSWKHFLCVPAPALHLRLRLLLLLLLFLYLWLFLFCCCCYFCTFQGICSCFYFTAIASVSVFYCCYCF